MFIRTNHLPQIKDEDRGIWVRMKALPFNVHFADDDPRKDIKLPEKLRAESEGSLAWLVEGAFEYVRNGLGQPPVLVQQTTTEYHETANPFLRFLREECEFRSDVRAERKSFYIRYTKWSEGLGLRPCAKDIMEDILYERGIRWDRKTPGSQSGKVSFYVGVGTLY